MKFGLRHTVTAAAAIGTAILLPTIALASSGSVTTATRSAANTTVAAGTGRCLRSQLVAWLGIPRTGFSNEKNFYDLEISNVSSSTCTLYGYPGVSAVNAKGKQLGNAAFRDGGFEALVTLAPGGTAHALLFIDYKGDVPASQCHPTVAYGLRVYAPGDYSSMEFPFSFPACAKHGPSYLDISTTVANTGIPGDS